MGVFYEVRVHVAEYQDDYKGRKGSSTSMGIRKVKKQRFVSGGFLRSFTYHKEMFQSINSTIFFFFWNLKNTFFNKSQTYD